MSCRRETVGCRGFGRYKHRFLRRFILASQAR
jgi:hypothetical protein